MANLESEEMNVGSEGVQVSLQRIEVSDGTVGWNVVRSHDATILGVIIRITRTMSGGRPRFSYYGRKESSYFGQEFAAKGQAVEYLTNRG
jgi:hypothetical protein